MLLNILDTKRWLDWVKNRSTPKPARRWQPVASKTFNFIDTIENELRFKFNNKFSHEFSPKKKKTLSKQKPIQRGLYILWNSFAWRRRLTLASAQRANRYNTNMIGSLIQSIENVVNFDGKIMTVRIYIYGRIWKIIHVRLDSNFIISSARHVMQSTRAKTKNRN